MDKPVQQPETKHVFIVTYGRSGSTLLQRVLQSIPGYFIRGENNHTLFPMYLAYRRAYEARYSHGKKPHDPIDPWYGADEIEPEQFAKNLVQFFFKDIVRPPQEARVIGFKEIRFHEAGEELFEPYLDFIYENCPGCRFVFNMRAWEDVSKSSWWATMDPNRVKEIIEGADGLYKAYAQKHPERCHLMQYEDHTGNPDAYEALFSFLGEEFDRQQVSSIIGKRLDHAGAVVGGPKESRRTLLP